MENKRRCGVLTGKPAYTWLCEVLSNNCAEGVDNFTAGWKQFCHQEILVFRVGTEDAVVDQYDGCVLAAALSLPYVYTCYSA